MNTEKICDAAADVPVAFKRWLPVQGKYVDDAILRPAEQAKLAAECNETLKGFFFVTALAGTGGIDLRYVIDDEIVVQFTCENNDRVPQEVDRVIEHAHKFALERANG